jgi:hypothetical protein
VKATKEVERAVKQVWLVLVKVEVRAVWQALCCRGYHVILRKKFEREI